MTTAWKKYTHKELAMVGQSRHHEPLSRRTTEDGGYAWKVTVHRACRGVWDVVYIWDTAYIWERCLSGIRMRAGTC